MAKHIKLDILKIGIYLFSFFFSLDAFSLRTTGESCSYDTDVYNNGIQLIRTTGSLRTGYADVGHSPSRLEVNLYNQYSYYKCKNENLNAVANTPLCEDSPIRGTITSNSCTAVFQHYSTSICVEELYKWVQTGMKQETIDTSVNEPSIHEAESEGFRWEDSLPGTADLYCGYSERECFNQWGDYCIEGTKLRKCNLPFPKCEGLSLNDGEVCDQPSWQCVDIETESNLCTEVEYTYNCHIGERECQSWENREQCSDGLETPDFSEQQSDPDTGLDKALQVSETVKAVKEAMSSDGYGITLFKGEEMKCQKNYFPVYCNCCGRDAEKEVRCQLEADAEAISDCLDMLICHCNENDKQLWMASNKGITTTVINNDRAMYDSELFQYSDKYSRSGGADVTGSVITGRKEYKCRWGSKIAKAIQEQGRTQLRKLSTQGRPSYSSGNVSFSRFNNGQSGAWKYLGNLGSGRYWVWQYPSSCLNNDESDYLDCPLDKTVYIIGCNSNLGCTLSAPIESPLIKNNYTNQKASFSSVQANTGFYSFIDSLTSVNIDCSGKYCEIEYKNLSRITPIASISWPFYFKYNQSHYNNGTSVNGVWVEGFTYGSDSPPPDNLDLTAKIRYTTASLPNADDPTIYTEIALKMSDGSLISNETSRNTSKGIFIANKSGENVYAFGSCVKSQNKCSLVLWSSRGVAEKPFFKGGHFSCALSDFSGRCIVRNYSDYHPDDIDCSGFTLDEFRFLDIGKMDLTEALAGSYTPIGLDQQAQMQNTIRSSASNPTTSTVTTENVGGVTFKQERVSAQSTLFSPSGSVAGNRLTGRGSASAINVDKGYCLGSCTVTVQLARYLQDFYAPPPDITEYDPLTMPYSPTDGKCKGFNIRIDWGDDSDQEEIINPAQDYYDPEQCFNHQLTEPYPQASHYYEEAGKYVITAFLRDGITGKEYYATVQIQIDDSGGVPEGRSTWIKKEGALLER